MLKNGFIQENGNNEECLKIQAKHEINQDGQLVFF